MGKFWITVFRAALDSSRAAGDAVPPAGTRAAVTEDQPVPVPAVVLAPDALVHLGDTDFPPPWMPLYGVRNPSTTWQGTVYLPDPGTAPWRLTMRVMQSNVGGNTVSVNGTRLAPPLPQEDFSGSWVSYTWTVPAGLLRPGANTIGLTIGLTTPVMQDAGWRCNFRF